MSTKLLQAQGEAFKPSIPVKLFDFKVHGEIEGAEKDGFGIFKGINWGGKAGLDVSGRIGVDGPVWRAGVFGTYNPGKKESSVGLKIGLDF